MTSSESNVRNMLIGKEDCDRWGASVPLGYFPDTFGNMGQTPQLMLKAGLQAAAFGRGIRPTGFNNQVDTSENTAHNSLKSVGKAQITVVFLDSSSPTGTAMAMRSRQQKLRRVFWDKNLLTLNALPQPSTF